MVNTVVMWLQPYFIFIFLYNLFSKNNHGKKSMDWQSTNSTGRRSIFQCLLKQWTPVTQNKIHIILWLILLWLINPLNAELNPICYLLALLGAHHFLHVSRISVKSLTLRLLMSYIYIYMEHQFLMFLDHTRRRTTVGRTPLDE